MKPHFLILPHCRRVPYRQRLVQTRSRRLYHHSNRKNDICRRDAGATAVTTTTNETHHYISSTIPMMGRGVRVGQYATTTRSYTSDDVDSFGKLIRDFNPLHSSSSISANNWSEGVENRQTFHDNIGGEEDLFELQRSALEAAGLIRFQNDDDANSSTITTTAKALVHGIFVSGIFSSIFATIAPGCVYVNQGLDFGAPVFVEDTVVGCIRIERIRDWKRRRKGGIVVECHTRVYKLLSPARIHSCEQHGPIEAQLSIKGRANVWLPIGYTNDGH